MGEYMAKIDLSKISTENRNINTLNIDNVSTKEICKKINKEDQGVAKAVKEAIPQIAKLIDACVKGMRNGGRIIYVGAGTSGRIGLLDAVECPPTYSCTFEDVQCLMAGGDKAFVKAVEGAEDNLDLGRIELLALKPTKHDTIIGIAASGRTPYVIGAIEGAKEKGAKTGCIVTSRNSKLAQMVDYPVEAITGAEPITGSTRMKSGTAQKMICNMITTGTMIKLGRVYSNLMIDVQMTNEKLIKRGRSILMEATGISEDEASEKIAKFKTVKKALFATLAGIDDEKEVDEKMKKAKGNIKVALKNLEKEGKK